MELKRREAYEAAFEPALLDRCRKQDTEAFGKLIDAYQNRVFGFVRRMVSDSDEAADVVQETFIRAFQAIHRFDGRSSLRTWLFRIAHNLCVDRARKMDRSPIDLRIDGVGEDSEVFEISDSKWNPEGMAISDEFIGVVEAGIEAMSEKLRSVLLLHDKEDMSYEEISTVLNLPIGTVKSRLFLARNQLRALLSTYLKGDAVV